MIELVLDRKLNDARWTIMISESVLPINPNDDLFHLNFHASLLESLK